MKWNGLPVIIFGSGGISKEVYYLLKDINSSVHQQVYDFLGFVDTDQSMVGTEIIDGYKIVSSDEYISELASSYPVIGMIIPIGNPNIKQLIFEKVKNISNVVFPNIIHPTVNYDHMNIEMGFGNIFTAGVKLTCDIKFGSFNLLNLNSTVGHDTEIGSYNVINPLVAVSGSVLLKDNCLVGTGAQILQGVTIHSRATVGAGAVVVKNVESNTTVIGIPAKPILKV